MTVCGRVLCLSGDGDEPNILIWNEQDLIGRDMPYPHVTRPPFPERTPACTISSHD